MNCAVSVAAAFHEQQLGPERFHQRLERHEVRADVIANGGVRATTSLDGPDAFGGQRLVAHQELCIFLREDVVCHDAELIAVSKTAAEREKQRGLSASDRPADTNSERTRAVVPHFPIRPLLKRSGARRIVVLVRSEE